MLAWDERIVVLRNERDEWELPGGRLDATDASPEAALRRECAEELVRAVSRAAEAGGLPNRPGNAPTSGRRFGAC